MQAIALIPSRAEAYFYMSKFYEKTLNWQECYTYAVLGLNCQEHTSLPAPNQYEGPYSLIFQKAISAWWIGRKKESLEILIQLYKTKESLKDYYISAIENNLKIIGIDPKDLEIKNAAF